MSQAELLTHLTDEQIVGLTIWAESRQEPIEGRVAVGCVIRNRLRRRATRFGLTYRDVCLKPWQFSCWRREGGPANHEALMQHVVALIADPQHAEDVLTLRSAMWVARGVMGEAVEDNVLGATHYYSPAGMVPKGSAPKWATTARLTRVIGGHRFYAGA